MPRLKVVAHKKSGELFKGYAELPLSVEPSSSASQAPVVLPRSVAITPPISGKPATVALDTLKALFFVRSFEGNPGYNETKFFNPEPRIEGLWVHLTFQDGEVTEGVLHNSLAFLLEQGFLLKPPDPHSNNQAVYVMKSALSQFRVVGVKASY